MSIEPRQALYVYLQSIPAIIESLKNGKDSIYQRRFPAGAQKPLIVIYPTISQLPNRLLDGVSHHRTRIQVTVVADTQTDAEQAANAVIKAVEGFTGLMAEKLQVILATVDNGRQVDQEGVDEIHHNIDVMLRYVPSA